MTKQAVSTAQLIMLLRTYRDIVVKVKEDPEDETEWKGDTDPFAG
jgi:hypothetical protein